MNHIQIKKPSDCCGCGACVQKCPMKCITMSYDEEGYKYPQVDDKKCINCNQCNKVCPLQKENKEIHDSQKPSCYIAYNKEKEIIRDSSSGGIFWLLVQNVINREGVVYGAVADGFNVYHRRGTNKEECVRFRKSKYLQSDTKETYKEAQTDLKAGKTVLYSGTPCQIAGLYSFLGKPYENLITCEVICHGVPSNAAFDKWLEELAIKHNGTKPVSVVWRDKSQGWGPNRITYTFENGEQETDISRNNLFQLGFLNNLYLRPSCYECKFARIPRIADISLADAWGYNGELLKKNSNLGLSLVLISTEGGGQMFKEISRLIVLEETSLDYVKNISRHAWKHPLYNDKRTLFFSNLKTQGFETAAKICLRPSMKDIITDLTKKFARRIKYIFS